MNELGTFIKNERLKLDMSLRDFGKLCDISHTHIDSIEKGFDYRTGKPVRITNDTLSKLATALHVEPSFLLNLSLGIPDGDITPIAELKRTGVKIPVLGRIAAGIPLEAISDIIDYEEISESMARTGEYIALKVKGKSMEPRIKENDVVIIKRQPNINSGELAVVVINGYDATLKKVTKQENGILLTAYNPEVYSPQFYSNKEITELPVEILGKVVELRAKF